MRQIQVRILRIVQLATVLAIIGVAFYVHRNDTKLTIDAAKRQVLEHGTHASSALVKELVVRETIATSVAITASLLPEKTEDDFTRLAERISQGRQDILNLAYAPDLVVRFVYPKEPNASVIGLDYRESSEFTLGADTALATNRPVLIGPVNLLQGGRALIMRVPFRGIRANGEDGQGLVSLVIDIEKLLEAAGIFDEYHGLSIAAFAGEWDGTQEGLVFGSTATCGSAAVPMMIPVMDTSWTFCMAPKDGWPAHGENSSWIIILTLLAIISTTSVFIVVNRLRMREATAKKQLWDAIEAINDGFALFDRNDRLIMFNSKYREIYSASAEVIRPGVTFREIIEYGASKGQYAEAEGNVEEWIENRIAIHRDRQGEHEQHLADGRWIKVSERRTSDGGTVGFRVDVTELKRAQHAAEASNRAITEFLNNINHEVRTPLSVIVGFIKFLSQPETLGSHKALAKTLDDGAATATETRAAIDAFVAEVKSYAERIQRSSAHLRALVQDTLDLSKITRGDFAFSPKLVDLAPLVRESAEEFSQQAEAKGIDLRIDAPSVEIQADPSRLRQILLNLVGNAVKFTDSGQVKVTLEPGEDAAVIRVADTGPGIAEEHRQRVFEKFWQIDGSVTRKHGGTGLGLAISKALVKLHGGDIWVESGDAGGAVFCVRLPRTQPPQDRG